MDVLKQIQHPGAIYAVAVSPDERLIACGGWAPHPISLWSLSNGEPIARLSGFTGQVQALAFSPDSTMLAAANVWGGLWVWQIKGGLLLHHKEPGKARRLRSLVFAGTGKNKELPVMLSDSINGGPTRKLAPNGTLLATNHGDLRLTQYKTKTEIARLDVLKYELAKTGVRYLSWSADSSMLALAGDGWAGGWLQAENQFFGCRLPSTEFVYDLAVLGSSRQILYTIGKPTLLAIDLPAEPLLTNWQAQYARLLAAAPSEPTSGRDWNWNVRQWGYEGVTLEAEGLLWYSHSHNTMGGGGAHTQSLPSFLADGPSDSRIPEDVLSKLCQAVNQRMTELRGPAPDARETSQSET
jgi:hypothetical protein